MAKLNAISRPKTMQLAGQIDAISRPKTMQICKTEAPIEVKTPDEEKTPAEVTTAPVVSEPDEEPSLDPNEPEVDAPDFDD